MKTFLFGKKHFLFLINSKFLNVQGFLFFARKTHNEGGENIFWEILSYDTQIVI